MQHKSFGEYYIGLDIGTSSVGWAVTDTNYNLLKFNQKAMWGSRLFNEGETAENRRVNRSARRRLERRRQRLDWLKEIFFDAINEVDKDFFQRLEDSKFYVEDKKIKQSNSLFNDANFKDIDYFKKYPTIFHLKKALMESGEEFDVRLVYLAIVNTFKHRGHFIFEGKNIEEAKSFEVAYETFVQSVNDYFNYEDEDDITSYFGATDLNEVKELLTDKKKNKSERKKEILKIFDINKNDKDFAFLKTILEAVVGSTINLKNLKKEDKDSEIKFSFGDDSFDEKIDEIQREFPEEMLILQSAKALHDWAVLEHILGGHESISFAKVDKYNEHQEDLRTLKKLVKRDFSREVYDEIFKLDFIENNYHAYIFGQNKEKEKKDNSLKDLKNYVKATQAELCKFLKKKLNSQSENPDYYDIFKKLEDCSFLPKQRDKTNAIIPYQINLIELRRILEKAENYLPFLKKKDSSGITNTEKLIKIMTFRIPYYVGPLNDAHKDKEGSNTWVVKKSGGKIYPWNFNEMVDIEKSAENFIRRMTNKCIYLKGKDVIPKDSLLYSEFMVLNELNNLKIGREPITVDLKNKIFNDLFLKNAKVTQKNLKTYLLAQGIIDNLNIEINGIDGDFKSSMSSYIQFKKIFGSDMNKDTVKIMIDKIIEYSLYFGEDTKLLKRTLNEKFSQLSEEQINDICKFKFSGWGRFSKEFLCNVEDINKETGEYCSILKMMRETNFNLMELLSYSFNYKEKIDEINKGTVDTQKKLSYDVLNDSYLSPKVKRSIWQSLKIVEEIRKITKKDPLKIFVEVARENQKVKERTKSRKEQLKELYKNLKEDDQYIQYLDKSLDGCTDEQLRVDKLFLYYTQLGRCMYSGETIDLAELLDSRSEVYDIDHIYPRCRVKDNSFDNKVLVKSKLNKDKGDRYPLRYALGENIVKNYPFWKMLEAKALISNSKLYRLMRNTSFSEEELAGFINRQLVEVRQSTKTVIEILKQFLPNTELVYSKAGNISDFRKEKNIIKVRGLNDLHHAKDAYLNIVVGNVYDTQFTKSPRNFIKTEEGKKYSLNTKALFDRTIKRGDVTAWIPGEEGHIKIVRKTMDKNNILFTRLSYEFTGELFNANPLRKGHGQQPLKGDERMQDINKYGGYNSIFGAYFSFVEYNDKNKIKRTMEFVPIDVAKKVAHDSRELEKYFEGKGLQKVKILIRKVKVGTLFDINGTKLHITGRTNNSLCFQHAHQLIISDELALYIKKIISISSNNKKNIGDNVNKYFDYGKNLVLYDVFTQKLGNNPYSKILDGQADKLKKFREKFEKINLADQIVVLNSINNFFACNTKYADLSKLGGGKEVGKITKTKDISKWTNGKIIYQSITGLFEKEVDLNSL